MAGSSQKWQEGAGVALTIVKLYYDYALDAGNGALVAGRKRSSFVFDPHWSKRPWPPRDKYDTSPTDEALGLAS
jgi:glutathione S-transferase